MRKIYPLFLLLTFSFFLRAQEQLSIKGNVTVQADGLVYVQGDVKIYNGATLDIQSSGALHGKVEVKPITSSGSWTCDGTTSSTVGFDGEVLLEGADPDFIYTIQGTNVSFPNLTMDIGTVVLGVLNTAKANVIDSMHVARTLDIKKGRFVTSAGKVIYVSNSAPTAIKSSGSGFGTFYSNFIEGSLRREVTTGATNYYKFPIGSTPNTATNKRGYNPAFVDLRTGAGTINARKPANVTSILAQFVDSASIGTIHHNQLAFSCYSTSTHYQYLELNWMVRQYGYWDLKPNGNPQGWLYNFYVKPDIAYIFAHNSGLDHMKIIKAPRTFAPGPNADWSNYVEESGDGCDMVNVYPPGGPTSQIYWKPGPNPPTQFPYSLTDSIRASGLISFSRFGLSGGTGAGAGLPIELLELTAKPVDNSYIKVRWATATEINNYGFEVQRSTDGVNFTTINWTPGNGTTSNRSDYFYDDKDVVPNQLYYYRLNQIDFDGASSLTYVVSAMITSSSTFTISEFIPNPAQNGNSRIDILTTDEMDINLTVYNTLGQIMTTGDKHLVPGTNKIDFNFNLLADGTYYAIFRANNEIFNRKLILTK